MQPVTTLAIVLVVLATTSYWCRNSMKVVNVSDYGLIPDSRENAVPGLRRAIEACRDINGQVTLIFPKGTYHFWEDGSDTITYNESNTSDINPKICPVVFRGISNLTLEANGSSFIYHGRMQGLTIEDCDQIAIRNLSMDWEIPFVAQAKILAVEKDWIDIRIDEESPYEIVNGRIIFFGENWRSEWWGSMEFDSATRIIPPQTADYPLGNDWSAYTATEIEPQIVRLKFNFARKPRPGNILIMRHSERDHSGIFILQSKGVTLENVNLHTAPGLGILAQYSENVTLRNCNVMPDYTKGRYQSTHADAFQVSGCRGHILVENCKFEGLMDDPINVHGTNVRIIEVKDSVTLLCRFMHHQSTGMLWGVTGDTAGFIENKKMVSFGKGVVKTISVVDRDHFEVQFEKAFPVNVEAGQALENLTWTPDFTVRNSVFGSSRARGLLVSTPGKVVIENNDFISSGSAILIAGDANYWYESGAVRDVLIRGNRFHASCLTNWYQFTEGVISIMPIIPEPDPQQPFHRNIRILDNHFDRFDYPVLYALSVDGLSFTGNTVIRNYLYQPWHPRKVMLTFEACLNVEVSRNTIGNDVLGRNIEAINMDANELYLEEGQGISRTETSKR